MDVTNLIKEADPFTSNVYLVESDRPVLIDAGDAPGIPDRIAERVDGLDAVVLTHQHSDHVGQLDTLVERFDPAVYAYDEHPLRTDALDDGDRMALDGDEYEVIHTPGHADDHIVLAGASTLFSGDIVVYEDDAFTGGSFGRTDRPGRDREQLIESIELLLDRLPASISTIYPGHGPSYEGEIRRVIETALERAERREPKYPVA